MKKIGNDKYYFEYNKLLIYDNSINYRNNSLNYLFLFFGE